MLAVLALMTALTFPEVVFTGKTLLPAQVAGVLGTNAPYGAPGPEPVDNFRLDRGTSAWQIEPLTRKVRQAYGQLDLPLWNASQGAGTPLLADLQPAVFNPLRLPVLISPTSGMWDLYLLGRLLLGGLLACLFARLLGFSLPARLVTAVGYVFSGFFVIYSNTWWFDIYLWLPLLLYAVEQAVRTPRPRYAALLGLATGLNLLAGMPEPSMVTLLLAGSYALYRLAPGLIYRARRGATLRSVSLVAAGFAAGFGLAAPTLIPFAEYLQNAFTPHDPAAGWGIRADPPALSISLLVPFFNGPPLDPNRTVFPGVWSGIRNYVGLVIPFLALVGLGHRVFGRPAWFFLGAAILGLLKTYGAPGVNDLGRLPLANVTGFPLWTAPVVAFCLAVLAGAGVDRISRGELRLRSLHLAAGVVLAALLALLLLNDETLRAQSVSDRLWTGFAFGMLLGAWGLLWLGSRAGGRGWLHLGAAFGVGSLALALENLLLTDTFAADFPWLWRIGLAIAVVTAAWAVLVLRTAPGNTGTRLGWACLILVAGELAIFAPHDIYRGRHDTFTTPPYVEFLQERRDAEPRHRIVGFDAFLFPNFAAAYGLDDIRQIDALYPERYIPYVRTFISPALTDRFVGGPYASAEGLPRVSNNPLFDLLGARYVITAPRGLGASVSTPFLDWILGQVAATPSVDKRSFVIERQEKPVLFAHAPSDIAVPLTPTAEQHVLRFSIALDPEAWSGPGDGVLFDVVVVEAGAEPVILWGQYLDPKHNPGDRRWVDASVDLSGYIGRPITLHLRTLPGPAEDTAADWSGWGDLRLTSAGDASGTMDQFRLVFKRGVRIYENERAFPRALILRRVEEVTGAGRALARMQEPGFDPARLAIIEGSLPATARAGLAGAPETDGSRVEILDYDDGRVRLRATMENPGLVILTDTYFRGWKARLDGEGTTIYPADYLFRGVFVPAGEHLLEFSYEPASFRIGVAIALVTLLALAVLLIAERVRKRSQM